MPDGEISAQADATDLLGVNATAAAQQAPVSEGQAAATAAPPLKLYIVRVKMASPFFVDSSREVDTDLPESDRKIKELTFKFKKSTRQQIQNVRSAFREVWLRWTVKFYGLHICNEDGKELLTDAVARAAADLKQIDESLKAEPVYIPLDVAEIARGALYSQVIGAIQGQVCETMLKRVNQAIARMEDSGKDEVHARTRKSIEKLLNQLSTLNIVQDKEVTKQIEELRKKIQSGAIHELKENLMELLKTSAGRYGAIEL